MVAQGIDVAACRAALRLRRGEEERAREEVRQQVLQAVRRAASTVLPHHAGVRRAFVFGSVLRAGGVRPPGDVDLALEAELDADAYFAVWRDLERALGPWLLHLVELREYEPFSLRVRNAGEVVYERRQCPTPPPES
ncbi:MAG: nucleotidyltransferase domain-containing protein [Candidatus Latescibacterota bacterium]